MLIFRKINFFIYIIDAILGIKINSNKKNQYFKAIERYVHNFLILTLDAM